MDAPLLPPGDHNIRPETSDNVGCALCSVNLHGMTSVACEKSSRKFHAEESCLGVNHTVIEVLLIENSAISYNCCVCRNSSNNFNRSMGQVICIIRSLVSDMWKAMAEMSLFTGNTH